MELFCENFTAKCLKKPWSAEIVTVRNILHLQDINLCIFDIFNSALTVYSHFFAKTLLKYVFSCSKNIVNVFYFLFVLQTAERQGSVPS